MADDGTFELLLEIKALLVQVLDGPQPKPIHPSKKYLTLKEASELIGLSVKVLRAYCNHFEGSVHAPKIEHIRIGSRGRRSARGLGGAIKIRREVCEAFIEARTHRMLPEMAKRRGRPLPPQPYKRIHLSPRPE